MVVQMQNIVWIREERTILEDVNWQVSKGEHWCLLGLNGSGKTTLLNMINGYQWPTSGKISVLGHTFGTYDLRELRKEIGWVSTALQVRLYGSDTALEIVLSGRESVIGIYDTPSEEDVNYAMSLLTTFHCDHLAANQYKSLSQGERQSVLIARALMNKPKLLVLDEPTTGLDFIARERLLTQVQQLCEREDSPTVIFVTHHIEEIIPCFTHTLLLKNGKVFASGTTDAIINEECLQSFYDVPLQVMKENERYWLTIQKTK